VRILFDARSVRTPSGFEVFRGLTRAWVEDDRVEEVIAAVPRDWHWGQDQSAVRYVALEGGSWARHLRQELPGIAAQCRADVIFSPNALVPKNPRAVCYYQDIHHFRNPPGQRWAPRLSAQRLCRRGWRLYASHTPSRLSIAVSEDIGAEVCRLSPTPIRVIPNGVDVADFSWSPATDAVFVMGGIGDHKGEDTAVRAWAVLPREVRGATRLLVGGVEPETRRARLRTLADQLGLGVSVVISGLMPREEYLSNIASSRLAISCSSLESFGLPVAEALVIGVPALFTALPAHEELRVRAGAGASYPVGDADGLSRLLRAALEGSPPSRAAVVRSEWSWSQRGAQHVDAYLELVVSG
jgi:glycosyltransferase involved in cell wall biosynthesis